jgi:hypothetical protein
MGDVKVAVLQGNCKECETVLVDALAIDIKFRIRFIKSHHLLKISLFTTKEQHLQDFQALSLHLLVLLVLLVLLNFSLSFFLSTAVFSWPSFVNQVREL